MRSICGTVTAGSTVGSSGSTVSVGSPDSGRRRRGRGRGRRGLVEARPVVGRAGAQRDRRHEEHRHERDALGTRRWHAGRPRAGCAAAASVRSAAFRAALRQVAARTPRATVVHEAGDHEADADEEHQGAADDERPGPRRGVVERPIELDVRRCRAEPVGGDQHRDVLGHVDRRGERALARELVEPQVGTDRRRRGERLGVGRGIGRRQSAPASRSGSAWRSRRAGGVGVVDRRGRDDLVRELVGLGVVGHRLVGVVAEPGLDVGAATVGDEHGVAARDRDGLLARLRGERLGLDHDERGLAVEFG